jgi:hypothetical protein
MVKIKNKTYQTISLLIEDKTILLPGRKSVDVDTITPQLLALKNQGLIQVIKK